MIRYEEWIYRANSSLELAQTKLVNYPSYEDSCFQAQQAAEKAIKGLLIYFGVDPEWTHNIDKLIRELKKFIEIPANINDAAQLTNYAVTTRYPGEFDDITKEEYEQAIKTAQECIDWVENTIKEIEDKKNT